ncbi:MAG: alpha/beta hydrolase [Porticoccaceae bacterium]
MKIRHILIAALFAGLTAPAIAQEFLPVQMPDTHDRRLHSEIMDYTYGVYVTLPGSYEDNPDKTYPTLYMIDGNQYYVFTGQPLGSLYWTNVAKEHITVAVAYTADGGNFRSRDFRTQARAADFVRFFQEELIPFVESNYRTSAEDRTLWGHSLGGQFTLYTMLTATNTFENYIASAPAVNDDILSLEARYAETHNDLPVGFYLASGGKDHLTVGGRKFVSQFEKRAYPGLNFDYSFPEKDNHGTIQPTAYIEGLKLVMDPALQLSASAYERLTGTYSDGENTYTISYDGDDYLSFEGVPESYDTLMTEWSKIYASSETSFFSKDWPGEFEFGGEPGQPAETFSFRWNGEDITAVRQ